jgi:lactate dehydrogenase-like 2-hydroxyacid dehydrogenase
MVLQVGPLATSIQRALRANFNAIRLPAAEPERAQFMRTHAHDITVIVTSGRTGAPATLIDELPALAAIVHTTAGYDATDIQAATKRSIAVSNTPDVLNDCVADTAVGLMIDVLRQFSASDRFLRAGGWATGNYPLTRQVSNTSVGIIGLGRIGTAISKRLEAFGCRIAYHNRRPVPRSSYTYVGLSVNKLETDAGSRAAGPRRGRSEHPSSDGRDQFSRLEKGFKILESELGSFV